MRRFCFYLAALALLPASLGQARAGLIFSDLGAGNSYNAGNAWTGGGRPALPGQLEECSSFIATVASVLAEVEPALGLVKGAALPVIPIEDDPGGLPGTVIESSSFLSLSKIGFCKGDSLVSRDPIPEPARPADTESWVSAVGTTSETRAAWNSNTAGQARNVAVRHGDEGAGAIADGSSYAMFGHDSILGPPSLLLLGSGAAFLLGYTWRWRRKT